jgi:chromosomal replication initiator protein
LDTRSAQEIWETALGELQIQVSKANYRTWLKNTTGLSYQNNQFIVGVPNTFVAEYLEQTQRSLIEKTLIALTRQNINVLFRVEAREQSSPNGYRGTRAGGYARRRDAQQTSLPLFNPKYTFNSFIVGDCNRLAHAAALEAVENPGHSFNPLFIYGGMGLGKTHLLHAIGHIALTHNIQVLHISAEQFTNEFINAIRDKTTEEFRDKYRNIDMLLIDDIQFLGGKEQTAESFFHTFNELHNNNRQIVITSNNSPKSMSMLEERLRSRFSWGLVADVQPPDFETRLAILQAKTKETGANITSSVLELIAQRVKQSIRELEGSLNRVVAYTRLIRTVLTPELATQALADIASKAPGNTPASVNQILEAVANHFCLSPVDLKSRKRDKETTLARQVAMYLIKQETGYSLAQIGREMGGREPITISHAYKKIANTISTDTTLGHRLSDIQQEMHQTKER